MKKLLLLLLLFVTPIQNIYADEYTELVAYRDSLKQQINAVDSEIAKCEKSTKGWKATTIIGGVGAVARKLKTMWRNPFSPQKHHPNQNNHSIP